MEWSNSVVLLLIDLYRERECLWNPSHNDYKNKMKKVEAWNEISDYLNCDTLELKKKIDSLLTSFRRERQKQDSKGGDKSSWFAFKRMQFLLDKFSTRKSSATDELLEPSSDSFDFPEPEEIIIKEDPIAIDHEDNIEIEEPVISPPSLPPARKKQKIITRSPSSTVKRHSPNSVAFNMLRSTVEKQSQRDESAIYGDYIASKHRKYSAHTRSIVEHLIGNILFNADMGNYDKMSHHQSFNTSQSVYNGLS